MADAKKKASSLADNPPIELYGPEDGGWYSTRVHDWIGLCVDLRDPDVRGYLVLRSLVIEKYKNPVRKLTLKDLCELIPSPTKGQPSSLTRVRGILEALSGVGLVSTPEGGPVKTSSRPSAAGKTIRIRVNDLPQDGYSGWRNTEDKLSHIQKHQANASSTDAGRKCDPTPNDNSAGESAGRKCDPVGRKSDPGGLKSDPDPLGDQEEREVPLVPTLGMESGGDAPSARSAVDVRRTSTTGSSPREAEGGSAASSNDNSSSEQQDDKPRAKTSSNSKARHTREQLDVVRSVRALYPPDLLAAPLPDVPFLSQAILDALAGDSPAADRTVEQLGKRIEQRWNHHGWASKFYAGEIDRLVAAAVDMVKPLKATDRYGCGNPRCEAGKDVDTGVDCHICPERIAARKQARKAHATPADAGPVPPPRASSYVPYRECACGDPIAKTRDDDLCRKCRRAADHASSLVTAQGPAPF